MIDLREISLEKTIEIRQPRPTVNVCCFHGRASSVFVPLFSSLGQNHCRKRLNFKTNHFIMATSNMGLTYGGQEKTPSLSGEIEFAEATGAPGGLFHADYKRHDDLKQMLDSSKDSLKLEAMKRIIGVTFHQIISFLTSLLFKNRSHSPRWWPKAGMLQTCSQLW